MKTTFAATLLFAASALAVSFNEISISGGVAGNAQAEADAALDALDADDLADSGFLSDINSICNVAEREGFNVEIDNADGEEADALQRGKTKNKVLKINATLRKLDLDEANGRDVSEKREEEEKKLANNVAKDEENAGLESTDVDVDADTDDE